MIRKDRVIANISLLLIIVSILMAFRWLLFVIINKQDLSFDTQALTWFLFRKTGNLIIFLMI